MNYEKDIVHYAVKNDSGEDIPAFGIMVVDDFVVQNGVFFRKVKKPSTTLKPMVLFNGPGKLVSGREGVGFWGPILRVSCETMVSIGDGVGIKPGQFTASKGYPCIGIVEGLEITSGSTFIASVRTRQITALLGKTTGSVTAGVPTTSYRIYGGALGSETDAGFTTVPSAIARSAIATNKFVRLTLINDGLEMEPLEC